MENYKFWDGDIEKGFRCGGFMRDDCYEIVFKRDENRDSVILHKRDVIHLAKCFGLRVFESLSEL